MARKLLLVCGILSSVLYVAMNVFVAMRWEGYSSASQTVSELSAIGAPTRALWVALGIPYSLLATAFGFGVWASARGNRALRVVGVLMIAYGATGFAWPFAPMHLRGAEFGATDAMHISLSAVTGLLYVLALCFGAASFGRRFRLYSIATLLSLLAFGVMTGLDGPRIASDLPTPWVGVWERIFIGVVLLWIVVLAIVLLRPRGRIRAEAARQAGTVMTLGGIGPRLALLNAPYVVLGLAVMVRDPGFLDLGFLDSTPVKVLGYAWLGAGLVFWAFSAAYFLMRFGSGNLITKGPFALCRNPIYASLIVFVIPSLGLLFHSGLVLSMALVLYIGFKLSIHGETVPLGRSFGREYETYEKSVNELVPFPRFLFAGAGARRSFPDAQDQRADA